MTLTRRSLLALTSCFAALSVAGGWANAATTSPDPAAPADAIKDLKPVMTMVGGKVVYERQ